LKKKSANQFTEAARNTPKSGPFPFFSLLKQHVALKNRHPPAHPRIEGDILLCVFEKSTRMKYNDLKEKQYGTVQSLAIS
jgi:hypothetical protein